MAWLEYNIHINGTLIYGNVISVLVDLIQPFVNSHRSFSHWHFLIEPNVCGSTQCEVRLRFEGNQDTLARIKQDLIVEVGNFKAKTNLCMSDTDPLGSHEGCHGNRNQRYQSAASESFGNDWNSIVDILQIGSESAIKILELGRGLATNHSLQPYQRVVNHPYYLHLPANQLIVEP